MTLFFSPYSLWPCNLRCLALPLHLPYHVCRSLIDRGGGKYTFWFCSDTVLIVYWCDNNPVQGCGIQLPAQYGKGCILGLLLFQSKQSTHDVFCHFPQGSYDYREALHHQTDLHPNFLHLFLVLGVFELGAVITGMFCSLLFEVVVFVAVNIWQNF